MDKKGRKLEDNRAEIFDKYCREERDQRREEKQAKAVEVEVDGALLSPSLPSPSHLLHIYLRAEKMMMRMMMMILVKQKQKEREEDDRACERVYFGFLESPSIQYMYM